MDTTFTKGISIRLDQSELEQFNKAQTKYLIEKNKKLSATEVFMIGVNWVIDNQE